MKEKAKTIIIIISQAIIIILIVSLLIIYGFLRAAQNNVNNKIGELETLKKEYIQISEKLRINEKKLEKIKENEVKLNEKINNITWYNVDLSNDPVLRRAKNTKNNGQ